MNPNPAKDTIYIDAEDEITVIIEKVRASESKVVALVLPKRAATLQSIVNLKLLKRTGEETKKNLVLITSEANLLPLAGAVGLHVAKTLQSKPVIPSAPSMSEAPITVDSDAADAGDDVKLDPHATIGQLAGHVATEETIDLDNDVAEGMAAKKDKTAVTPNKKLKVPNFDRFRLLLFGGAALLLLLIIGGIFAFVVLPKAKVVIKTDSSSVNTDLILTAKTDAKTVDAGASIVPATNKESKKSDSEKVSATGQRDDGTKATGTMTITNCSSDVVTLNAGTVFTANSLNFLSTDNVSVPKSSYSNTPGGFVCDKNGTKNVGVTAQNGGDKYNLSARQYQISNSPTNVSASGSDMNGGTSKITQVVSQQDVDSAKQKVIDRLNAAAGPELKAQFTTDKSIALEDTLTPGAPTVASTPNVGDAGSTVTVSVTITFDELGVKQDDLKQLVEADIKKHIDVSKQVIQDNGLGKAVLAVVDKKSASEVKFEVKTLATAGPQLDGAGIKKQIAGKKKGQSQSIIQARPGIKDVTITYSPFWVYSTPKNVKHITVIFDQNNAK
ncbi:MAG TPA: hypothetical protein VLE74_01105 [Candidatus Saccharimonadales bacterium]|nr:hypothetical protein [Candidatus Saccharimonadales bacterium]